LFEARKKKGESVLAATYIFFSFFLFTSLHFSWFFLYSFCFFSCERLFTKPPAPSKKIITRIFVGNEKQKEKPAGTNQDDQAELRFLSKQS
jgi:hypothetical protein